MTADSTRRLLSIDLLDEGEHADLDEWGNRAVLTQPATPVSIPVVFAAQVGRTPEAVAPEHEQLLHREDLLANVARGLFVEVELGAGVGIDLADTAQAGIVAFRLLAGGLLAAFFRRFLYGTRFGVVCGLVVLPERQERCRQHRCGCQERDANLLHRCLLTRGGCG